MDAPDRVEDEFVCPEVLRGSLGSQRDTVERIFGVSLTIGNTPNGASEQMWLRLRGSDRDVKAAKMFVRGLVDQEEMQEVFYPAAVNCVFCGARGFFLDCLIKSTSAHIAVVSPGLLLISGLVEPVVRAYSLVTDLLKRYEGGQASSSDTDERGSGELCYSPRAFKALVEKWEDRHILDLLVLPRSVKEALLELVKESGLVSNLTPGELEVESHESSRPGVTLGVPSGPGNDRSEAPGEATEEKQPGQGARSPSKDEDEVQKLSAANTEFLLKFFTAMGFTEEVVKWILAQTGPIEASQILDLIQQEQDYSDREHQSKRNPPCEMDDETVGGAAAAEVGARHADVVSCAQTKEEDDFMLGVLKKAAVSCGYTEHDVAQACSLLPDGSTHLLLLELQKEASAGMEDSGKKAQKPAVTKDNERSGPVGPAGRPDLSDSAEPGANPQLVCTNEAPPPPRPDHTKRPPGPTYAHISRPKPQSRVCSNGALQAQRSLIRFGESGSASTVPSVVVVTGKQRFLEGLQTPFKLQLMDRPGNPKLRTVVIDGSNVAMSHGRGHFFSCRGIALAVQHFWERGHRHISTLLPQWRQKSDPCIREQHFLGELQKLGLLSFTPSREVLGNRITSYDDRLMLQLAQKTDGVIVTNDNLRDLLDESVEWREIIKKRLLQYTFVGDHFMVPDDPLGRGGPHLDQFLTLERRAPDRRDHSFAGAATNVPPVNPPSSQIQVHNFPGAPNGTEERSQSQGQETERVAGHRHTHRTSGDRCPANRTVEATTSLRERLCQVFPGQDNMVMLVLQSNPTENDLNVLSTLLLER